MYNKKNTECNTDYSIFNTQENLKTTKHEAEIYKRELDITKKKYSLKIEKSEKTLELENVLDKKKMEFRADRDTY